MPRVVGWRRLLSQQRDAADAVEMVGGVSWHTFEEDGGADEVSFKAQLGERMPAAEVERAAATQAVP